jgi:hypothetical protein
VFALKCTSQRGELQKAHSSLKLPPLINSISHDLDHDDDVDDEAVNLTLGSQMIPSPI